LLIVICGEIEGGLRPDQVAVLAESIATIGLQQPITVRTASWPDESTVNYVDGYEVVAGLHRLEACRSLGHTEIDAQIFTLAEAQRQLWEIDENLCRAELTELERGEHLLKRKEIYEWLRPETKAGIAQAAAMNRAVGNNVTGNLPATSFAAETAEKTGLDQSTVRRSIRRAERIAPEVRDQLREKMPEVADSGVELDALAAMPPEQQRAAVEMVQAREAATIRDAQRQIENGNPASATPKTQPHMARARKPAASSEPREPASQTRDKAISGFSHLLRQRLSETLDDLTRVLRDEQGPIEKLPMGKRVMWARAYLDALGVDVDSLQPADQEAV
jgi:ParB family chromosome partitioning protein